MTAAPRHPDSPVDWAALARSADTLALLMAVANPAVVIIGPTVSLLPADG